MVTFKIDWLVGLKFLNVSQSTILLHLLSMSQTVTYIINLKNIQLFNLILAVYILFFTITRNQIVHLLFIYNWQMGKKLSCVIYFVWISKCFFETNVLFIIKDFYNIFIFFLINDQSNFLKMKYIWFYATYWTLDQYTYTGCF